MFVPANQSNSWQVFWQHVVSHPVIRDMEYTSADCEQFKRQAMASFDRGESVELVAWEMKVLIDVRGTVERPTYYMKPEKSPLALARRVVRM